MLSFWEKKSIEHIDTAIIGGGITGLSTAISLAEKNRDLNIAILEAQSSPSGASTKNAGFACFGSLTEILHDLKTYGTQETLNLIQNRVEGLRILTSRVRATDMDYHSLGGFELLNSTNVAAQSKIEEVNLQLEPLFSGPVFSEEKSLVASFGFNQEKVPTLIKNPLEGQLNPYKMIRALTAKALSLGVSIWYSARVSNIEKGNPFIIEIPDHQAKKIKCEQVVVCTNAFTKELIPELDVTPGRGQVLITQPIENLKLKGTFHIDEGYVYFRNVGKRLLIGGARNLDFRGETTTDFGNSRAITDSLNHCIKDIILPKTPYAIQSQWSGIMAFGSERKPIISSPYAGMHIGVRLGGMGVALGSWLGEELAKNHHQT